MRNFLKRCANWMNGLVGIDASYPLDYEDPIDREIAAVGIDCSLD